MTTAQSSGSLAAAAYRNARTSQPNYLLTRGETVDISGVLSAQTCAGHRT